MNPNIHSRLEPTAGDGDSRANHDSDVDGPPPELVEFESEPTFEDDPDLERLLAEGMEDGILLADQSPNKASFKSKGKTRLEPREDMAARPLRPRPRDEDDDVPKSLLLEAKPERRGRRKSKTARIKEELPMPVPGPNTTKTRAQWERTRQHQRLHSDPVVPAGPVAPRRPFIADPGERARWTFANIDNYDRFIARVYYYYEEHGIWSIILRRIISGLTATFVFCLSTFTFFCIDYSKLPGASNLSQVRVPQCTRQLPMWWNIFGFGFCFAMVVLTFRLVQEYRALVEMHDFYQYMLDIPDTDIQTVSWPYIISKIMELRDANINTATNISASNRKYLQLKRLQRMDAHDIANRLMRRENYWIAMINKDILDFTVNFPFLGKKTIYTRSLEWNVSVALMDWVFDDNGNVRKEFRTAAKRAELVAELQRRFFSAGVISVILALPMAAWAVAIRFLRSYTEYQKNPAELSARRFTLLAEWKIRDFNEVSHLFNRRKKKAYAFANRYLDQFPKDKLNQVMRFSAFIPGALAAILGVVTLWDPELFLGFDIAGKTVLFWIGILGTMFVLFRNAATDDDDDLWDPEVAMEAVIYHTHYCPDSWKGRLYSEEVRREFSSLYKLEALLFLEDVVGSIVTPFMLMWSLPRCAGALIDFFREFTIDVDGLGTVCSYAMFNFQNGGKAAPRPGQASDPSGLRDAYYGDKANKLMESYLSFLDVYGPNPTKRGSGGGMRSSKRPFHPPPSFPGFGAGMHGSAAAPQEISRVPAHPHHQISALRQSMHTPRFGPSAAVQPSPMHSILLDPHHQPRHSPTSGPVQHPNTSRRAAGVGAGAGSTLRQHHSLDVDPVEEPDDDDTRPQVQRTTSNLLDDDPELGESWFLKGGQGSGGEVMSAQKSEEREKGDDEAGGVLGMLMQLQRTPHANKVGHI